MTWQIGVPSTKRAVVAITRLSSGTRWRIHAHYIRHREQKIETWDLDDYTDYDYDEKRDVYFVKEGWYEVTRYHPEYYSIAIEDPVIAWTEMPSMEGVPK